MTNSILTLLLSAVLVLFPTTDSSTQKSDFDIFIGNWTGKGTLFGTEGNFSMSWKKTVDDKFIELNFENMYTTADGTKQKLSAKAIYWFTDEEHLKGNWYDSRGVVFPLKAEFKKKTLTALWGDDDSEERGKTVYQLTDNKNIIVTDFVWQNGKMNPFGKATYQKAH